MRFIKEKGRRKVSVDLNLSQDQFYGHVTYRHTILNSEESHTWINVLPSRNSKLFFKDTLFFHFTNYISNLDHQLQI
jgi:hypothetical protein